MRRTTTSGEHGSRTCRPNLQQPSKSSTAPNDDLNLFVFSYPGVACDIPSVCYQFTWKPKVWSKYYADGKEIWEYLRGIVDKYKLERFIKLRHTVVAADWDQTSGKWHVTVQEQATGRQFQDVCDVFLNAGGILKSDSMIFPV
jgi:cation diffusion facilitator CzcD-associated flavoprotein CzcO